MMMASSILISLLLLFISILLLSKNPSALNSSSSTNSLQPHISTIKSICKTTPYPGACFSSLKPSISINISPNILSFILQSLKTSISESLKLSDLFNSNINLIEKQRGTLQDCRDLHQITLSSLQKTLTRISSPDPRKLSDAKIFLSAALTNKLTCLEGLTSASGPTKSTLQNSITDAYRHVSNSLSILSRPGSARGNKNRRRLLGFPKWMSRKSRRVLLQRSGDEYDPRNILTVAADGSGNFTTVTDAINFAPSNSEERIIVYVRRGVYRENVEIPSWKPNIVMLGDGSDVTVISGSRSVADGWTTFRSATVVVSCEGFLARDITFQNTAGPQKHQAVALSINADLSAVYRCTIDGYQDTLYVHSFRQFYRECNIYGTIDYISGNAAVVFQACNIVSKMPIPGQTTVITAQSRDSPDEVTGISLQNCSILATKDLYANSGSVKSYLGRPWKNYALTVYLESYIDGFIEPEGWLNWDGDQGLDTLYYGEYENYGPGSSTDDRVSWPGFHIMDYDDASSFTVSTFIDGEEWLDSTSFPYDDGV